MNFALSTNYSEIDFDDVSPLDLVLVGGGCGDGGGGSGSVSAAQVQAAYQSAAAQSGPNSVCSVEITGSTSYIAVCYSYSTGGTHIIFDSGLVNSGTGAVTATAGHISASGGGFWSSVGSFFSWLFGSH